MIGATSWPTRSSTIRRFSVPAIAALPGAVAKDEAGKTLWVRCGDGAWIEIVELQPAGKRRMSAQEFLRGNSIPPDARMGGETA